MAVYPEYVETVSIRMPGPVKAQLEKAASTNVRSLSGEILVRLLASLKEAK
jgi:hypothetical protein